MSKIVPVSGPLSIDTLGAAYAIATHLLSEPHPEAAGLTLWMLGDDHVPLKVLTEDLGLYVSILETDETRDDLRRHATDALRRLSRRYRLDASCGAVDTSSLDDTALRTPDIYQSRSETKIARAA